MADAAWAELCSGESAAKQAAVTKLLRKQEKAKVVEKKRNAVLKKKKKAKDAAPAPEVEVPAPETPKPPPPPETAVALLRRLARAIQQLGDERSETRKQGLQGSWFNLPKETQAEAFMRRLKKSDPGCAHGGRQTPEFAESR